MSAFPAKAARPFARPVKTCERVELRSQETGPLFLLIGAGKENKSYLLSPLASDFGRAFRLEARIEDDVYFVLIDGPHTSCDCKGWLWSGGCKHVAAILKLLNEGRL